MNWDGLNDPRAALADARLLSDTELADVGAAGHGIRRAAARVVLASRHDTDPDITADELVAILEARVGEYEDAGDVRAAAQLRHAIAALRDLRPH